MGKIYKNLKATVFIVALMLTAGTVFAQYTSTQSGPFNDVNTWGGVIAPPYATDANVTISSGDTVTFSADLTISNNFTLTVETGAALIMSGGIYDINVGTNNQALFVGNGLTVCSNFTLANKADLTLNGTLIAVGTISAANAGGNTVVTGTGTIYALAITATQVTNATTITQTTAVNTWQGTADTDWLNAANWSGGAPSAATDRLYVFNNGAGTFQPIISTTEAMEYLLVDPSATLNISSTGAVTVDSTVVNEGTITLESTAVNSTGNLFVGKNYIGGGTVNVERSIGDALWHIVSSPVVEDLSSFYTNNAYIRGNTTTFDLALGTYDETNNAWSLFNTVSGPLPSGTFEAARAYLISIQNVVDSIVFTGDSIFVGDQSVTLTKNGGGWNGIGNPYTTSLDIAQFLTDNSGKLDATYTAPYVWDAGTSDYISTSTGNVAVGQGFLVKALAGGEIINFNSGQQVVNSGVEFKSATVDAPELKLIIATTYYRNQTVIAFEKDGSTGMESGLDLGKLKGNPNIALYSKLVDGSMPDVDFYRQSLRNEEFEIQTIPIGLDLTYASEATFTLETVNFPEDAKVYLEDTELGLRTLLNAEGAEYNIELPSLNGSDRFNLVVENFKSGQITTGIEPDTENLLNVYSGNGKIIINGPVSRDAKFAVYGIDGRMVVKTMAANINRNEIDASGFPNGIYLVRIEDTGKLQTKKVIVNNR